MFESNISLKRTSVLALFSAAMICPTLAMAGYPAGTVMVISFGGDRFSISDNQVTSSGHRSISGGFDSYTTGAVATADGRMVEAYWFDGAENVQSGLDVIGPGGDPELRALFDLKQFNGIALDPSGNVWVSDSYVENQALQVDLESGSLVRSFPLDRHELLQDCDSAGYFYFISDKVVKVRDPEGRFVRDFTVDGQHLGELRVDADGQLIVASNGFAGVYVVSPTGDVTGQISLEVDQVNLHGFDVAKDGTLWFDTSFQSGDYLFGVAELDLQGNVLHNLPIPDESDILGAIVSFPRVQRGSLCTPENCTATDPTPTATDAPTPTVTVTRSPIPPSASPTADAPRASGCEISSGEEASVFPAVILSFVGFEVLLALSRKSLVTAPRKPDQWHRG